MRPSHLRFARAAAVALLVACVDGPTGPGSHSPATLRLRITLPAGTPAAWTPSGETLHVALRRAGRVEPIVDTSIVVGDSLGATLTVPLAYAVERFVVLGEARYGGLLLFLGFDVVQLQAAGDTAITVVATYVGPGSRAASYALGARDSTLGQGDTASLVPVVRDSVGQLIPNVPARYVAANPSVVAVDAAGTLTGQPGVPDTARITGYLPMGLSSSLVVRRVPPVIPGAGTRTWQGNTATWSDAANWDPPGVPTAGDTVDIQDIGSSPMLDVDVAVAELRVNSGNLNLNGHTLTVSGDFGTANGLGTLTMQQPDDTLRVLGNAVFHGGPTRDSLTDGVLLVAGAFEQRNDGANRGSFQAYGNHRTVLNGSGVQRFHVEGDATFGHLEIANTGGGIRGELEQTVEIDRTLRFTTPAAFDGFDVGLDVGDSLVMVAGSRLTTARVRLAGGMAVAGTFNPPTVEFAGDSQAIQPGLDYQNVEVTDDVRLTGPTSFAGYLVIEESGNLTLNGQTLSVALLNIGRGTNRGELTMQDPADVLTVTGDAMFDGDSTAGLLTDGVLRVAGNVTVGSGSFRKVLRASGNHRTVLNGAGRQDLLIAAPATFHHLEIANDGGVEVPQVGEGDEFTVGGKLRIATPVALDGLDDDPRHVTIDVGDSLVTVAGSAMNLAGLVLRGGISLGGGLVADRVEFAGTNQLVPASVAYRSVTVSGTARLTGTTVFDGFVLVRGLQANLTLGGHKLTTTGTFAIGGAGIPEGSLTMSVAADTLIVTEDMAFSGVSTTGLLTAGTLIVGGGFFQAETPTSFAPSGTYRVILNGAAQQRVRFDTPGAGASAFTDLELANTAGGLRLESTVPVMGLLRATGAAQLVSGTGAHLAAAKVDVARLTLDSVTFGIGGGTITRFDSVTFQRQDRTATQLVIAHAGTAAPLTFTGLRFLTPPSSGLFVSATDLAPADGAVLTIVLAASVPGDGSAQTATTGGAVVNWLGGGPPPSAAFVATGSMVDARYSHESVLLQNGRVLVVGGLATRAELYDTATGAFTTTVGSISRFREGLTATTLYDGRVLITGGGQIFPATTRTAELYDPATQTFALTDSLGDSIPVAARGRRYGTATLLPDGRVIVTGGEGVASSTLYRLRTAEAFDPISESFTVLASPARARSRHVAALLPGGRVLVAGGQTNFVDTGDNHAEIYDPVTNTWSPTGVMTWWRNGHTATVLADGRVLITGGSELRQDANRRLRIAEIYDPSTGAFTATDSMAFKRQWHTATLLADGRVLITGGLDENNQPVTTAELYDPIAGTFSTTGTTVNLRDRHAVIRLPDGRVLVTGGFNGGSAAELYVP